MKLINILSIAALLVSFASCEEFQPVFTGKYENPEYKEPIDMSKEVNTTIAQLKDMYTANGKKPFTVKKNVVIGGQVTTSDKVGNLYKSLYIQDESAGIELKIGKNGLYNEFKLGQWVYVDCNGLTVGDYNGMIQLGYEDPTGEYETSYMEHQYVIDAHVYKGAYGDPVEPKVITESELKKKENLGRLVTIKDLTYKNEVFVLLYYNPNGNRKDFDNNCLFLATSKGEDYEGFGNCGIDTWAMSEMGFKEYLKARFDGAIGEEEAKKFVGSEAYSVSQYFSLGSTDVQVRTSGYSRFADEKIDAGVLDGSKKIDFTGILTEYKGAAQFTLIDLGGVNIHD